MSNVIEGTVRSESGFYVGDICYAMRDDLYHDFWGGKLGFRSGIHTIPEIGFAFAVDGTAYGDGSYIGSDGFDYGVDAGVIGVVPLELAAEDLYGGRVFVQAGSASFRAEDGVFDITLPDGTAIHIDTTQEAEEEEDDEDWRAEYAY